MAQTSAILLPVVLVAAVAINSATAIFSTNDISPFGQTLGFARFPAYSPQGFRRRCPLCDSSVYTYCTDKLFHDSCCCNNPNNPYDRLPFQCQFADCSFLHANTCQEHKLITACCCTGNGVLFKK